jgi:predicted regulator of Ras-like GTPase activity (Roadblock/LC7/MglB family)
MSFASILRTIVEECGGGVGAALMGTDGIPIDQYTADISEAEPPETDVTTIGIEFGRILLDIRKASDGLDGGSLDETIIELTRFTLVFRPIDSEYFLLLVMAPDGNLGKARYLIRRHMLAIRQEL